MGIDFKKYSVIEPVKYLIAMFHIAIATHSWSTLGSYFSWKDLSTWSPVIIMMYTILFFNCFTDKRWAYYTYIGMAMLNLIIVFLFNAPTLSAIQKAFWPFYLVFAAVLILDLKRIIYLAYNNRSVTKGS